MGSVAITPCPINLLMKRNSELGWTISLDDSKMNEERLDEPEVLERHKDNDCPAQGINPQDVAFPGRNPGRRGEVRTDKFSIAPMEAFQKPPRKIISPNPRLMQLPPSRQPA
jgi:hypothetical protein